MFVGARPRNFLPTWKKLTSDPEIVLIVKGAELEFAEQELPFPICSQPKLEESEMSVIDSEVEKLEATKKKKKKKKSFPTANRSLVIIYHQSLPDGKKDGSHHVILNLKELNKDIAYDHFKMETLQEALNLITPNCFLASTDLRDAYNFIPIAEHHRTFLRLLWRGQLLQYDCWPYGLVLAT